MDASSAEMSLVRRWLLASRPATLTAAIIPVMVGCAIAWFFHRLDGMIAIATLVSASLIQIGTNFVNDVSDFEKGADTEERLGPVRVVQAGLLTAGQVKRGILVVFLVAAALGLYLTSVGGLPILLVGVLSILSGIAYTAGPFPLGYNGLGDVFVMLFFGLVAVCGTVFLQLGSVPLVAVIVSIPIGAIATGILVVNNVRDVETDVKANKRTLVVRFGRSAGVWEYRFLLGISYAVPVVLATVMGLGLPLLLPLFTVPLARWLSRELETRRGAALNEILAGTAKLLMAFGLLLSIAFILVTPPH